MKFQIYDKIHYEKKDGQIEKRIRFKNTNFSLVSFDGNFDMGQNLFIFDKKFRF